MSRGRTATLPQHHWYRIHWCQVCGREDRIRVYGAKPSDPDDRYSVTYCGCLDSDLA